MFVLLRLVLTCFNVIHYKRIIEVVLYTYISFSFLTILKFFKIVFRILVISVDVCGLTLSHQIWVYLYIILQFIRLYLTLQQMYGVGIKEGGGWGEGVGS